MPYKAVNSTLGQNTQGRSRSSSLTARLWKIPGRANSVRSGRKLALWISLGHAGGSGSHLSA
eukprot:7669647-Pyramimonas_sp.AAC.1